MNAPGPLHWTLNSCFVEFRSVWVHLGLFRYSTKLDAIWVELVTLLKKYVPRGHVGQFCNERTWSSPLDNKLFFWLVRSVWVHLGSIRYCTKLDAIWAELLQLVKKVHATKSCGTFSHRMHLVHPMGPKTHVLLSIVVFGCIWDCFVTIRNSVQFGLKLVQLVKKVHAMKLCRIFSQRTHLVHSIGP